MKKVGSLRVGGMFEGSTVTVTIPDLGTHAHTTSRCGKVHWKMGSFSGALLECLPSTSSRMRSGYWMIRCLGSLNAHHLGFGLC